MKAGRVGLILGGDTGDSASVLTLSFLSGPLGINDSDVPCATSKLLIMNYMYLVTSFWKNT